MTRIVLYTTPYCGYCRAAKALLERKGLGYVEIDVSGDFAKREEMMARAAGRWTVPQIFIEDRHVGGSDELARLEREARLDALLAELGALAAASPQ
jgi:glutaredoxin 3